MADDLAEAVEQLDEPESLTVVSTRDRSIPGWVGRHLVSVEAQLARSLGGSLASLHARVARFILQAAGSLPLRPTELAEKLAELSAALPRNPKPDRQRLADDEVKEAIRRLLTVEATTSRTVALRQLRASGQACEQSRFARLFAEVRGSADEG